MLYVIGNKRFSVSVESTGAQPVSVKKDGKEMLWQNENGAWGKSAPILFPFAGGVKVIVDGKEYPKSFHGVARDKEFSFVSQTQSALTMSLKSSEETKKVYPFDFEFTVTYAVRNTALYITYEVLNPSVDKPLYFACGGHESFNIDGKLDDYFVQFEKTEKFSCVYIDRDGNPIDRPKTCPVSDVLYFKDFPILNSETLVCKNVKSSFVKLVKKGGEAVAETHFKGFKNLLFWRAEQSPYICIEPWKNLPDVLGKEDIEFKDKTGVEKVLLQSEKTVKRKIVY